MPVEFQFPFNTKFTTYAALRNARGTSLESLARICYVTKMQKTFLGGFLGVSFFVLGCSDPSGNSPVETPNPNACDANAPPTRTISCVEEFAPGADAGFGGDNFPEIIYDEPIGNGDTQGSIHVLSLGRKGTITFGFGGNSIINGDGPDFTLFENPFRFGPEPDKVFRELGEVSVSLDGETWFTFPCDSAAIPPVGCAGSEPVFANGDVGIPSTDPMVSGGDQYDLETLGLDEVRFVRIRDVQGFGAAPTAGFDLDAAAIIHAKMP